MWIFSLVLLFTCGADFHYDWDNEVFPSTCLNIFTEMIAGSAADFVMDVLIFSLPVVMILQLQMSTGRKIVVIVVFLTGSM